MSEKVKLPREVAEAIETISRMQDWERRILECMHDTQRTLSAEMLTVHEYYHHSSETCMKIVGSLVNGYEVEETPEEQLKRFYDTYISSDDRKYVGMAIGIKDTLNILKIKIEGINK